MKNYDIIHFEAMGAESSHLDEETRAAIAAGKLPQDLRYLIVQDTVQEFLAKNPEEELPDLITIKTHSKFPDGYLDGKKKSIITRSAGYDHVEMFADRANITSLRNYCVNAVAETGIKLMYCACGLLNEYGKNAATFERNKTRSFMELNEDRIVTVFGVGKIGKRVHDLCKGNGLTVQAVDVRAEELDKLYHGEVKFVSKEEALATSDIIINVMNLTRIPESKLYNVGYFSEEVLRKAKPGLVFINVTRGEIAPETGILKLYKEGHLYGFGTDVFSNEAAFSNLVKFGTPTDDPNVLAGKELLDMSLAHTENVYTQAHQAFNSDVAASNKAHDAIEHMIAWYAAGGEKFDEQLPYYQA